VLSQGRAPGRALSRDRTPGDETRWGSCSSPDRIALNLKLVQVPKVYIDHVVTHELCHLIERNHSPRFHQLLDRAMPDWRDRKRKLDEYQFG
jgi:predicted metal-dependent hydrolase